MKRLSEFIRLGGLLGPQVFRHSRGPDGGSCALVGALDAAGIEWTASDEVVNEVFPALAAHVPLPCPAMCELRSVGLTSLIVHLNDQHLWSRELIADHIEHLEQTNAFGLFTDAAEQKVAR